MTGDGNAILGYLRPQRAEVTAETIARDLGRPMSEVLGSLLALERHGLVEARQTGAWSIAWRLPPRRPAEAAPGLN